MAFHTFRSTLMSFVKEASRIKQRDCFRILMFSFQLVHSGRKSAFFLFPANYVAQNLTLATSPKGLMRCLFHAHDFVSPPHIHISSFPLLNPFANDITCLHIVTRCLPTHLSSVCSSVRACPVLPTPLFLLTPGEAVCVGGERWEGGTGLV